LEPAPGDHTRLVKKNWGGKGQLNWRRGLQQQKRVGETGRGGTHVPATAENKVGGGGGEEERIKHEASPKTYKGDRRNGTEILKKTRARGSLWDDSDFLKKVCGTKNNKLARQIAVGREMKRFLVKPKEKKPKGGGRNEIGINPRNSGKKKGCIIPHYSAGKKKQKGKSGCVAEVPVGFGPVIRKNQHRGKKKRGGFQSTNDNSGKNKGPGSAE